jgi:hypothetical protein
LGNDFDKFVQWYCDQGPTDISYYAKEIKNNGSGGFYMIKKSKIILAAIGILLVLVGSLSITVHLYNYDSQVNRKDEDEMTYETYKKLFLARLKRLGVLYDERDSNKRDDIYFIPKEINGLKICDEYFEIWIRVFNLVCKPKYTVTVEELCSLYTEENDEIKAKFSDIMSLYGSGGKKDVFNYIFEIRRAYDKYLEVNNEKFNGVERSFITIDDSVELEKWILDNPDPKLYPNILYWYGVSE